MSGGFVASQVHIGSYQDRICRDAPSERQTNSLAARLEHKPRHDAQQIVAHSFEFVALPGRAEGIQAEIPIAMGTLLTAPKDLWDAWFSFLSRRLAWSR
jgi:hypothetical protein